MFLRIVNVHLIFKHSQQKPNPFGIKINIDLEATIVEVKIHIYLIHFDYTPKKAKQWGNDGPG